MLCELRRRFCDHINWSVVCPVRSYICSSKVLKSRSSPPSPASPPFLNGFVFLLLFLVASAAHSASNGSSKMREDSPAPTLFSSKSPLPFNLFERSKEVSKPPVESCKFVAKPQSNRCRSVKGSSKRFSKACSVIVIIMMNLKKSYLFKLPLACFPSALLNQSSSPPLLTVDEGAKLNALLPVLDTPELESQWCAGARAMEVDAAEGTPPPPQSAFFGWSGTKSQGLVCCTGFTNSSSPAPPFLPWADRPNFHDDSILDAVKFLANQ